MRDQCCLYKFKLQSINQKSFSDEINFYVYVFIGLTVIFEIQRLLYSLVFCYIYYKVILNGKTKIPINSYIDLKNGINSIEVH